MEGMSKFQLISLGIFGAFILIGVSIFALGKLTSNSGDVSVNATVWGTIRQDVFESALNISEVSRNSDVSITYVEKNPATIDQELVEALAVGEGPDLFFLPYSGIIKNESKIFTLPFESYPERDFKNNFIEVGELFLSRTGVLALPFIVDPLVMYWNRDIFTNAGISVPPKYWSEMYDLSAALTKKDSNLNITQSALSLGEYTNITNAFEIMSLLMMQAGTPLVVRDAEGFPKNFLTEPKLAAEKAVSFFTEFSNPLKQYYSWNRSLPSSKNYFLAGDLALYFGFASELSELRLKNPNLNFDVEPMPQVKDAARAMTYGKIYGLAIPKNSRNPAGAYQAALILTSTKVVKAFSDTTILPPVRRDLLAFNPTENHLSVFYQGALQSKAWLTPDPTKTPLVFKEMIESITSGRNAITAAISTVNSQLNIQLGQ